MYHSLFQINRVFTAIANHCTILEETRLMPIVKMRIFRGYTRELQSQISHDVVDRMHALEDEDMYRFEKTRIVRGTTLTPIDLASRKPSRY
jgi:hypothetical protein